MSGILSLQELAARLRELQLALERQGEGDSAAHRRARSLEARFVQREAAPEVSWTEVADARALLRRYGRC